MNSKSFIFGKNYDSDYLSGKRLKRKTRDQRNDKNYRRYRRKGGKVGHRTENENPIEKCRKHLIKTYDRRISLKPKPIDSSTESYRRNFGIYANGRVGGKNIGKKADNMEFKARIKEDLFWILNNKSQRKRQLAEDSDSSISPPRIRQPIIHKPIYAEKETQINSINDFKSPEIDLNSISREDKQIYSSHRLNPSERSLNVRKVTNIGNKTSLKGSEKHNLKSKLNSLKPNDYKRSELKRNSLSSKKTIPPLPTSLTIVQSLMNSYEDERQILNKNIPEFGVDLATKICHQLRQTSKSFKQSIEHNLIQKQSLLNTKKRTVGSPPKSSKLTKDKPNVILSGKSVEPLSMVPYNQNEPQMALKQFEPRIGNMLSKLLLNISDAFQTLSSKCADNSFFD